MGGATAFTLGGHWAERMTPTLAGVGSSHWKAGKGCASRWHPRNPSGWIHWGERERCVPLRATVHHKVIPPPGLSLGFSCLPTPTILEISICVFSLCLLRSSQASREGLVGGVPESVLHSFFPRKKRGSHISRDWRCGCGASHTTSKFHHAQPVPLPRTHEIKPGSRLLMSS